MAEMKNKIAAEAPAPRRKRARKFFRGAQRDPAKNDIKYTDEYLRAYYRHLTECEIYKIYAAAARRAGDPTIRPRDYYCECAPSLVDYLPLCEGKKPVCRFAGRLSPEALEDHHSDARLEEFHAHMQTTLAAMAAMGLSRKTRRQNQRYRAQIQTC